MFCFGLSSLYILQTYLGVIGLAWVGTMCKTSWAGYNAGVNEKRENVLATSEVSTKDEKSSRFIEYKKKIWMVLMQRVQKAFYTECVLGCSP